MAPFKVDNGYEKAKSNNLPIVTIEMLADFFNRTTMYVNNESSGVKAKRSMGAKYGDEAVGRVQIKKTEKSCNVIAAVTPEHKINSPAYRVIVDIDLRHQKIKRADCKGCIAALGGCKHAIAVIGWLHRRSEEPSPTEEICYWRKSTLATVDISKPYDSEAMESSAYSDSEENDSDGFIANFAAEAEKRKLKNCHFLLHYNFTTFSDSLLKMSLHHLIYNFLSTTRERSPNNFIDFCKRSMNESSLKMISKETKGQYKSALWRELRYGRITGSIAYEVAHCHTKDGSTVEKIFGKKVIDTKSMKRGRELEPKVKLTVEKLLGEKITECGLWLQSDLPIFGASPDGFGPKKKYCVEIKCPATDETFKTYLANGKIVAKKYFAQVQLQMHITNVKQTKFCVAHPTFERDKKVDIIDVHYDRDYVLKQLVDPCIKFWTNNVFTKLCSVVQ